jgi:hypothetical protein
VVAQGLDELGGDIGQSPIITAAPGFSPPVQGMNGALASKTSGTFPTYP